MRVWIRVRDWEPIRAWGFVGDAIRRVFGDGGRDRVERGVREGRESMVRVVSVARRRVVGVDDMREGG